MKFIQSNVKRVWKICRKVERDLGKNGQEIEKRQRKTLFYKQKNLYLKFNQQFCFIEIHSFFCLMFNDFTREINKLFFT